MSKLMIVRIFWSSFIALFVAVMLTLAGGILLYASRSLVMAGSNVVGLEADPFAWSMVALAAFGALVFVAGAVAQLVAWIAAVLNTVQLEDKAWFAVLLITGLLGIGLVAMIAYAIAGPEGIQHGEPEATRPALEPQPVRLA
jgi:hypothetical protein